MAFKPPPRGATWNSQRSLARVQQPTILPTQRKKPKKNRKYGRYLVLGALVTWGAYTGVQWIKNRPAKSEATPKASVSSSSQAAVVSSSTPAPESSVTNPSSALESSVWNSRKSKGQQIWTLDYSLQRDTAARQAPKDLHPAWISRAIDVATKDCPNQAVRIALGQDLKSKSPSTWSWECNSTKRTYNYVGTPQSGRWTDSSGCTLGTPCWQWPASEALNRRYDSSGHLLIAATTPSVIYAPVEGKVLLSSPAEGGVVKLQHGWEWEITIRGLQPQVKTGQILKSRQQVGISGAPVDVRIEISRMGKSIPWRTAFLWSRPGATL